MSIRSSSGTVPDMIVFPVRDRVGHLSATR